MTYIIAEIGFNHLGDISLAKKMIDAAKSSGADSAKFQSWKVEKLSEGPWTTDGRAEIYKSAELSNDDHVELIDYCKSKDIDFLSSAFDVETLQMLSDFGLKSVKIASTDCNDINLLKMADSLFEKVIVSTGASTFDEIKNIVKIVSSSKLILLHCVSMYPCPPEKIAMKSMQELKKIGAKKIGYSGHLDGIEDALLAIALGAEVIEKHFTTDKDLPGRDNKFALNPEQLSQLVDYSKIFNAMNKARNIEFTDSEHEVRSLYRGRFSGNK
jgi:N,N'-diacetyllegionaminate synthase